MATTKQVKKKVYKKKENGKNATGAPSKWNTVGELQSHLNKYFWEDCFTEVYTSDGEVLLDNKGQPAKRQHRPWTITGMALALDTNRETLINYQNDKKFFDTISRAKLMCHNYAEEMLFDKGASKGAQFNLKNNYGWKDKTETESTVKTINVSFED